MSLYSRGRLVLLTLGPVSPCTSPSPLQSIHPSPSAPIPLLGAHGWVRYSPMGLAFGSDQVEEDVTDLDDYALACRVAEFEIPLNSDYHFHFDVALSTGLL